MACEDQRQQTETDRQRAPLPFLQRTPSPLKHAVPATTEAARAMAAIVRRFLSVIHAYGVTHSSGAWIAAWAAATAQQQTAWEKGGPNVVHPMAKTSEMREDSRWDFEVCRMFGPQIVFSHIVDTCARAVCWAQRASRPKGGKRRTAGKRSHGAGTGQRQGGWARLGGDVMGSRP